MDSFDFKIIHQSKQRKYRRGILKTPHGDIQTPAFVTVGTKGTVKSLTPENIESLNAQFIFVNTYHMVLSPGLETLEKSGGIRNLSHIQRPLISDSGGFQVFSLAKSRKVAFYKSDDEKDSLVKIDEDGVQFRSHVDGEKFFFTPEFSIQAQRIIGADFMVAFDECASSDSDFNYTKKAMDRTHRWAVRSLDATKIQIPKSNPQKLYGVIQGGKFEELRKQSANYITSLPFFGLAIGGVAVGGSKQEMRNQVEWVMEIINEDQRPRHLLGVGEIDDIFDAVDLGMDTMDCVTPTRHARMGSLYVFNGQDTKRKHEIDINKNVYKNDLTPVDPTCGCYTCRTFTKSYLHHLFKERELLSYHLATIHNLWFMEHLFQDIRDSIENETFGKLKDKWV